MTKLLHISEHIDRDVAAVYMYASKVENLAAWAAGVTPNMQVRFAKNNYFGILDHWVTVGGATFYNPMRVIEDGAGSEVIFTLRGTPEIDPADEAAIVTDLAKLKQVLEG